MRTFYIENFGCRASQADGAALETLLENSGLQPSPEPTQAELIILNTCTVTASADADARASIRRHHREHPQARILVTGCYAQRAPEEIAVLPGVEWVVGNGHKSAIPEILQQEHYHTGVHVSDVFAGHDFYAAPAIESLRRRARPHLKIQDGCHNRCAFCVIPFVRGGSRFMPISAVIEQIARLSERYREVVLTGINLGRWGRETGSSLRLAGLLRGVLAETAIDRVRLSSVEPMDWSSDLIAVMSESERVARHVHMPLQSGADRILRAMRRKYRPRHYEERLLQAWRAMPDAAIGADVMCGFPGETDELFDESRRFIESLPLTYLHVFTYSERPGTAATSMPDAVPMHVRRERTRILRDLSELKNRDFHERMRGRTLSAVTLEQRPFALTSNYIRVEMANWPGPNRLVDVRPTELSPGGMRESTLFRMFPS